MPQHSAMLLGVQTDIMYNIYIYIYQLDQFILQQKPCYVLKKDRLHYFNSFSVMLYIFATKSQQKSKTCDFNTCWEFGFTISASFWDFPWPRLDSVFTTIESTGSLSRTASGKGGMTILSFKAGIWGSEELTMDGVFVNCGRFTLVNWVWPSLSLHFNCFLWIQTKWSFVHVGTCFGNPGCCSSLFKRSVCFRGANPTVVPIRTLWAIPWWRCWKTPLELSWCWNIRFKASGRCFLGPTKKKDHLDI